MNDSIAQRRMTSKNLKTQRPAAPISEKRRAVRTPETGSVIMAYGEGENLGFEHVRVMDCSPHGVGLLHHRPLRLGMSFLLKLNLKPIAFAVYDVRHCRLTEDRYTIGAEFHGFVGSPRAPDPDCKTICKSILMV